MSHAGTILLVEDELDLREVVSAALMREGYEVIESSDGEAALTLLKKNKKIDLLLCDVVLGDVNGLDLLRLIRKLDPLLPVVLMSGYGTIRIAVEAMKLGAFDFLSKPFELEDLRRVVKQALEARSHQEEPTVLAARKDQSMRMGGIVGQGSWKQEITQIIARVAPSRATVLLCGESGTGKELVARAIHENSARRGKPFVAVACAALPRDLLESELFGHEKGSFTGAIALRPGRFELADGGTIFLDEISEVPLDLQVKLLRVLQEREFERVGGARSLKVDVRVIAATNRDLAKMVSAGSFREDLYYRLRVIELYLLPLRQKKEDIPLLASHFISKFSRENGKRVKEVPRETMELLLSYAWPGNVRELENAIEHAVVMAGHEATALVPALLPLSVNSKRKKSPTAARTRAKQVATPSAGI